MQRTELIGIVSSTPKSTETKAGIKVCTFDVRIKQSYGDCIDYYRVTAYHTLAEDALKDIEEGATVFASGELHPRLYESGGKTFMILDLIADSIEPHSIPKTA